MNYQEIMNEIDSLGFDRNGHLGYIIFESLPDLAEKEKVSIADKIASKFASNDQVANFNKYKQHLETSFMRKIFGLTERNGAVLTITHPGRIDQQQKNIETISRWDRSFDFADILEGSFSRQNKQFGKILLYEGLGHRHGDLAVASDDRAARDGYLEKMMEYYGKSCSLAKKLKCPKQMFVLSFWAGCYYYQCGYQQECINHIIKFNQGFVKYYKVSRVFYKDKMAIGLKLLRKCYSKPEYKKYKSGWLNSIKDNDLRNKLGAIK